MIRVEEENKDVEWCIQNTFNINYAFVKTRDAFKKEAKRLIGDDYYKLPSSPGFCTAFTNKDNEMCIMIFVDYENSKSKLGFLSMLVHEITHIKQEILSFVGETKVGVETEAYMMGEILIDAYDSYRKFFGENFLNVEQSNEKTN